MDKLPPRGKPAKPTTLVVTDTHAGQRLDRFLKTQYPAVPFIGLQKLLRLGKIRINGKKAKADTRLQLDDTLMLPPDVAAQPRKGGVTGTAGSKAFTATKADLAELAAMVIHEDQQLMVLNKPAGLAAQAGSGISRSLDRLLAAANPLKPPKLVHRLDRETTGIIVCAKNRTTAAAMGEQFAEKTTRKTYLVLVVGTLSGAKGSITAPIAKRGPIAVIDERHGDAAHTTWVKRAELGLPDGSGTVLTLLEATPHTGRMNQLRVHFAHLGVPLAGDAKYGTPESKMATRALHPHGTAPLYLHAARLGFKHPFSGQDMQFAAPLPPHFQALTKLPLGGKLPQILEEYK